MVSTWVCTDRLPGCCWVVRRSFVAISGQLGKGLERWPCQLGLGIRVASQMPNQVDRRVVALPGKAEVCVFC